MAYKAVLTTAALFVLGLNSGCSGANFSQTPRSAAKPTDLNPVTSAPELPPADAPNSPAPAVDAAAPAAPSPDPEPSSSPQPPKPTACVEAVAYDPSDIKCSLQESKNTTVWSVTGSWVTLVAKLTNKDASWISSLAAIGTGPGQVASCPAIPNIDKMILVTHFTLDQDTAVAVEAIIDNVGQVRLWQDADPTKEVYSSLKGDSAFGTVQLAKGYYSVVIDALDLGGASGVIASFKNMTTGNLIRQTVGSDDWCIFRVQAATDIVSFLKNSATCRKCFVGAAFKP